MHSSKHVNSFQTTGNLELQEGQLFEKLAKSPISFFFLLFSFFFFSLQTISGPQRKLGKTTSSDQSGNEILRAGNDSSNDVSAIPFSQSTMLELNAFWMSEVLPCSKLEFWV